MKAQALSLATAIVDPTARLNGLREYLQAFVLRSLHESRAFRCLSFVGGTALRFAYGLPRFSEDLDFSLESPEGYDPQGWMDKLARDLLLSGFDARVILSRRSVVNVGWIRVASLLHEANLSPVGNQTIAIKVEIDTAPPRGAVLVPTLVNRCFMFALRHHNLPSLLAGKIHAIVTRAYVKGRDWYDLLWYTTQHPPVEPNLSLLQAALDQSAHGPSWAAGDWRSHLLDRLQRIDVPAVQKEVRPFLERPEDRELLTLDNLLAALGG